MTEPMTYEEFARKMDRYTRQLLWLAVAILGANAATFGVLVWIFVR